MEEMHTAMVNRSIRTIKAVRFTRTDLFVVVEANVKITGTRIPHRCSGHLSADPLGSSPAHAPADCPPCAPLRWRRSDSQFPGWYPAASGLSHGQHEPPEQRLRTAEWRLRTEQSGRRKEGQQLLPASIYPCRIATSSRVHCSSWTPSSSQLPASRASHRAVSLQLQRRW